ncbi:response regulator transcription factor [Rhizobium calliandrae]|uniref:Response regulator transcription factor n=1 Tax=Rhizobium calliandrae TaxID=1312182 RepID=A0ABT7KGT9_9HYPH|nr:response regulator transcription factor [Rhizobium calliandrae]MDL2407767.1 response regulator transcription factor [Rhizobium calliandrae]
MTPHSQPIRILCVDDHPLVREGIAALVSSQLDMAIIAEASDGYDAVEKTKALRPDVILMDLQMPGMGGIEAINEIRRHLPNGRVIVLTTYAGDDLVKRALLAGAQAYLLKSAVRKDLLDIIRAVHRGQKYIHPEAATGLATHLGDDSLSVREISVLKLIADGNSNKIIAVELSITEETVKGHVKNILGKLRATDRTQAVTIGLKRGIIEL